MRHPNHGFVFLNILIFSCQIPQFCSKVSHLSNILESTDHMILSDTRIIIDNAIDERQIRGLMDLAHSIPSFNTSNPVMMNNGGKALAKYVYQDIGLFYEQTRRNITQHMYSTTHLSTSLQHNMHWTALLMEVEVRIIEAAEAFFNRSLTKFNSALFYRSHTEISDPQESQLAKFNNGSGWLVPVHVDNCKFDQGNWKCSDGADWYYKKQVSAVLFLNDLSHDDAGGEFVFLDSTRHHARDLTPAMKAKYDAQRKADGYDRHNRRKTQTSSSFEADADYYEHLHAREGARDIVPSPPRAQIRRALHDQAKQRALTKSSSKDEEFVASASKFTKVVSVSSVGINYTVVLPRAGRLAIFNSSVENIHAVTQILNSHDRRYTLFMFLRERNKYERIS